MTSYRFDVFQLDERSGHLIGPDGNIPLRPRTHDLLRVLVQRAPDLLTREQLFTAVWGHQALTPNVLVQSVRELRQALGDDADAPRFIETRSRRGYRFIAPVTRVDTAPAAAEVPASVSAPVAGSGARLQGRAAYGWAAAALVAVAIAITLAIAPWPNRVGDDRPHIIAVLQPTETEAMDPPWMGEAYVELLTMALQANDRLNLVQGDVDVATMRIDNDAQRRWLHDVIGAEMAVTGSWRRGNDGWHLDLELVALENGRPLLQDTLSARADTLDALASRIEQQVSVLLDETPAGDSWMHQLPEDASTRRSLMQGLAALAEGDSGRAIAQLAPVSTQAASSPRLVWALARAHRLHGNLIEARTVLNNVLRAQTTLSVRDRLLVEAELAELDYRSDAALAAYGALLALYPDDLAVAFARARVQAGTGQTDALADTLARIAERPAATDDPRYPLYLGRMELLRGDRERAREAAAAALAMARTLEIADLEVESALLDVDIEAASGQLALTVERLDALLADPVMRSASGDLQRRVRIALGSALRNIGDFDAAERTFNDARAQAERNGSQRLVDGIDVERALAFIDRGSLDQADALLADLPARIAVYGDAELDTRLHSALGQRAIKRGDNEQAAQAMRDAVAAARRGGRPATIAGALSNAGLVEASRRRFDEARVYWNEVLPMFRQLGDRRGEALVTGNLAGVAMATGDAARAMELNQQALTIARDAGLTNQVARIAFNIGLAHERAGQTVDAETALREAHAAFTQLGNHDSAAQALASHVRILLSLGHGNAAAQALDSGLPGMLEPGVAPLRVAAVHAARAELERLRGNTDAAEQALQEARRLRAAANEQGWVEDTDIELLRLALDDADDLQRITRRAEDIARSREAARDPRGSARARLLQTQAQLRAGDTASARSTLVRVDETLDGFPDVPLDLQRRWLLILASDDAQQRVTALEKLADDTERAALHTLTWQIRASAAEPGDRHVIDQLRRHAADAGLAAAIEPRSTAP